ncbi:hypothetical protein ABZ070_14980 [Streptomyces sp. NPDC006283]|uniref:hypothetical protein n=1 Tax=Streptomyces sp. NPDC006283 TaxID=3156741 RepID=UPI0033B7D4AD
MTRVLGYLLGPLVRFLSPKAGRSRRPPGPPAAGHLPYSCAYVGGPTAYRTGERPPRGEDSPLVRPYLVAHEERQKRQRRRVLLLAVRGVDVA